MRSRSRVEVRRCRPILGTFVEVTAAGMREELLQSAIDGAFAAIEKVHRLMSSHDPESELSRLNREALTGTTKVDPQIFEVLERARQMAEESGGAFDCTVAPTLARWGLLPPTLKRKNQGCWRDVALLRGRKVRFMRPLAIDLGGIAKGFAVDRAIEALRNAGVRDGIVNAGGDLRVFGARAMTLHLRHPAQANGFAGSLELCNMALATSSPCFTERKWRGKRISHLVDPASGNAVTGGVSVSVRARECWMADALTKVVLNAPEHAERLLELHEAEAFVLTA